MTDLQADSNSDQLGGPGFRYIWLNRTNGGAATAAQRLPQCPAIYAWFRDLSFQASDDDLAQAIVHAIGSPAAVSHTRPVGPLHQVTLTATSRLPDGKTAALCEMCQVDQWRTHLRAILTRATILQAPLYVGKANNLRSRFLQHIDPLSDLAVRLRGANVDIGRSVFAYSLIDGPSAKDDQHLLVIEDVLTRLCRPGFVLRPG